MSLVLNYLQPMLASAYIPTHEETTRKPYCSRSYNRQKPSHKRKSSRPAQKMSRRTNKPTSSVLKYISNGTHHTTYNSNVPLCVRDSRVSAAREPAT